VSRVQGADTEGFEEEGGEQAEGDETLALTSISAENHLQSPEADDPEAGEVPVEPLLVPTLVLSTRLPSFVRGRDQPEKVVKAGHI